MPAATSPSTAASCTSAWTRYRHPAAPAPWPHSANSSPPPQPATPEPSSSCDTKSKNTTALHELLRYVRSPGVTTTEQTDRDYVSIGCATLFLNYLHYQLGFSLDAIVGAG